MATTAAPTFLGPVQTDGARQWFLLWVFVAVIAGMVLLGILLSTRNKVLAIGIVLGASSLALFLPSILVLCFVPQPFNAIDWVMLGVSSTASASLFGYAIVCYATDHAANRAAEKARLAQERRTLMVGGITYCDYLGLTVSFVVYLGLALSGRFLMTPSTDTATQAIWILLCVVMIFVFAGFAFHITRYTIYERYGSVSLCCCFSALFAISVSLILLAPSLVSVIAIEGIFATLTGLITLVTCVHCCTDCLVNKRCIRRKSGCTRHVCCCKLVDRQEIAFVIHKPEPRFTPIQQR